ncbi:MAG: MFS family permease [Sulfurimonas sp.]|jgi:MFS family permease
MLEDFLELIFTGILASLNYVGYLGGSIFSMFLKDINAKVKYFRIGMFLCVIATLFLGISSNETVWIITRVVAGFGAAMALIIGSAIVMTKLNMKNKSQNSHKHAFDKSLFTPFVILLIIAYFTEGVGMVVQATFLPDIINSLDDFST